MALLRRKIPFSRMLELLQPLTDDLGYRNHIFNFCAVRYEHSIYELLHVRVSAVALGFKAWSPTRPTPTTAMGATTMPKYRVRPAGDNEYQVRMLRDPRRDQGEIRDDIDVDDDDNWEEKFTGSLADCEAFIRLKQNDEVDF